MNQLLLDTVKRKSFDLVLFSKTDTVDYTVLTEVNKYAPTWYFFMDAMDQALRINAVAYALRTSFASATFSDVTNYFREAGANAHWITQGVDTEFFRPKEVPKIYDVVFAGTKTTGRLRHINALRNAGISVICFGEGWENKPVYQDELVDIYRKSRIVLNFCRPGTGFSIRVFQVMGTGAFMLSEYCPDLERFFKKEEHLDWFKDEKELTEIIKDYLADEEAVRRIAKSGCAHVHRNYSWESVMRKIIDISEDERSSV